MKSGRPKVRRRKPAIAAHPAFAAILGLWGAALGGLAIMVLPARLIGALAAPLGFGALGGGMQPALALGAALVSGGGCYALAAVLARRARAAGTPSVVEAAARRMRTIDPARDLGSQSLDAPITAMPFGAATDTPEPLAERDEAAVPRALDLAEFAALPGRNAVWVEDAPAAAGPPEPPQPPAPLTLVVPPAEAERPRTRRPAPPPVGAAALARLRATPTQDLSMIEMVERFAGAIHERRASPDCGLNDHTAAREAALAEALRALATLSGKDDAVAAAQPLDDALARLKDLRGAA